MLQATAQGTATTPVRAADRIDQAALERYLCTHVPAATRIRGIGQSAAGQSIPTYLIEGSERRFRQHSLGTHLREAAEIRSSLAKEG